MLLRDAQVADLPAIVDIYNSTIPGRMVTADTQPISVESRLKWFNDHIPGKRPLMVLEQEKGYIIGWVSLHEFYGRAAYQYTAEISIYLDATVRSKGLGMFILNYVFDKASSYGIRNLIGFIFAHNEPSLRLFRKAGFEEWGYLKEVAVMDEIPKSVVIMGKNLS